MSALALTACAAAPTVGEAGPGPEPPTRCATSPEAFDAAALDYATEYGLPAAWVAFQASERVRALELGAVFVRAREQALRRIAARRAAGA